MSEGEFKRFMLNAVEKLGARAISEITEVAPSTVYRWVSGVARPHPLVRQKIVNDLKGRIPSR